MALPEGVFAVKARGKVYFYHQKRRGRADEGERTRLPEPNSPEWFSTLAALTEGKPLPLSGTLAGVWAAYVAGPRKPKTEGTLETYKSAWKAILPVWGDLPPSKITPQAIARLHDAMSGRDRMANMVLTVLRNILGEALRMGLVSSNAAIGIKPHEIENVDGARPLSAEAWAALLSPECPNAVYRVAILGRATGQRISDLVRMTPAMIERNGMRHPVKKRARKIDNHWSSIRPEYLAIIQSWGGFPSTPFIHYLGIEREGRIRREWNAYVKTDAGKALAGYTPHDLRATNFCDHILAGDSPADVARIRGVTADMVIRYTQHLKPEDFADARQNKA